MDLLSFSIDLIWDRKSKFQTETEVVSQKANRACEMGLKCLIYKQTENRVVSHIVPLNGVEDV